MPNFTNLTSISSASGLKNYNSASFSTVITGQTLGAGAFTSAIATTTLSNTNSLCQVQTQYSGLESFTRIINGVSAVNYSGGSYQVGTFYYFSGSTLSVYTYVANQTGGGVTIPTITINCRAFLFQAPF